MLKKIILCLTTLYSTHGIANEFNFYLNMFSEFNRTGTITKKPNEPRMFFRTFQYSILYNTQLSENISFNSKLQWPSLLNNFNLDTVKLDFKLGNSTSFSVGKFPNPFGYYNNLPLNHHDRLSIFEPILPENLLGIERYPYALKSYTGFLGTYDGHSEGVPVSLQFAVSDGQYEDDGIKTNRMSKIYSFKGDFFKSENSSFGLSYFNYVFNTLKLKPRTIEQNSVAAYYRFQKPSLTTIIEYMGTTAKNKIYLNSTKSFKPGLNKQETFSWIQAHHLSEEVNAYFLLQKRSIFYFSTHSVLALVGFSKQINKTVLRLETYAQWFGKNVLLLDGVPRHGLRLGMTAYF